MGGKSGDEDKSQQLEPQGFPDFGMHNPTIVASDGSFDADLFSGKSTPAERGMPRPIRLEVKTQAKPPVAASEEIAPQPMPQVVIEPARQGAIPRQAVIGIVAALALVAVAALGVSIGSLITLNDSTAVKTNTSAIVSSESGQNESGSIAGSAAVEDQAAEAVGGDGKKSSGASSEAETVERKTSGGNIAIVGGQSRSDGGSTQSAYSMLVDWYGKAGDYDRQVQECAAEFNAHYSDKSTEARLALAVKAENLKSSIDSAWSEVKRMNLPSWYGNYEAWQDLCECYECLHNRICVIYDAWNISLKYDEPAKHKDEILAPIKADQKGGDNKYYLRFKELYPTIKFKK